MKMKKMMILKMRKLMRKVQQRNLHETLQPKKHPKNQTKIITINSEPSTPRSIIGQESFKNRKTQQHQKQGRKTQQGPSSVKDIKAKMQTSIEKVASPKWKLRSSIM